jgi:hypothetical protein
LYDKKVTKTLIPGSRELVTEERAYKELETGGATPALEGDICALHYELHHLRE